MKYLVMSDIHGVYEYAIKIHEIIEREQPDLIILLGDLYSHRYNDTDTIDILNRYAGRILCTRGNCDTHTDISLSKFKFNDYLELIINNKTFFFTHGHLYDIYSIPLNVDVFVFGHLHTHFIKYMDNKICVNTGSLSMPRHNTSHSYVIIDDKNIIIKDIDNNIIDSVEYITEV